MLACCGAGDGIQAGDGISHCEQGVPLTGHGGRPTLPASGTVGSSGDWHLARTSPCSTTELHPRPRGLPERIHQLVVLGILGRPVVTRGSHPRFGQVYSGDSAQWHPTQGPRGAFHGQQRLRLRHPRVYVSSSRSAGLRLGPPPPGPHALPLLTARARPGPPCSPGIEGRLMNNLQFSRNYPGLKETWGR